MGDKNRLLYYFAKGCATIAICLLSAFSMHLTNGETGIGWAVLGLFAIWGYHV